MSPDNIRPTKKQKVLLDYIEAFITEHGYSPSYREIMSALGYNAVATVALHVNSLISRGHLQKRDHSARSLEIVHQTKTEPLKTNQIKPSQEKWLVEKVEFLFRKVEDSPNLEQGKIDELYVLVGSLRILGLEGAAQSFIARLSTIKKKMQARS